MLVENIVRVSYRHATPDTWASSAVHNSTDIWSSVCWCFTRRETTLRQVQVNFRLRLPLISDPILFIGLLEWKTIKFVVTFTLAVMNATSAATLDTFLTVYHTHRRVNRRSILRFLLILVRVVSAIFFCQLYVTHRLDPTWRAVQTQLHLTANLYKHFSFGEGRKDLLLEVRLESSIGW